ncbi:MAG: hypothetical protein CMM59_18390 [Rhodospirillaceae bacterium]|nr:hypothetical protein [Rhodospirillaceae bacterium]
MELEMSGSSGEIDGYQYALVEQTGLIAVRRPDGSFRMLPGADDIDSAVRQFIALDLRSSDD